MLPISEWDWAGLWSSFFLPLLVILGVLLVLVAIATAIKLPGHMRRQREKQAFIARWDIE